MGALEPFDHGITAPQGFRASGVHCGIKRARKDLALLYTPHLASAAAVFTSNAVKAAPILLAQQRLQDGVLKGVVINSGNANALTGPRGLLDAELMASRAARTLGEHPATFIPASTGVIGRPLPMRNLIFGISVAAAKLAQTREAATHAARAILTTDTVPKEVAGRVKLRDGTTVTFGGMAKGSGMIAPQLRGLHATTLGFVTTDAAVPRETLQAMLERAADATFNMVSVDGDQSTNDLVVVLANGQAGNAPEAADGRFEAALTEALAVLARKIAQDGEGATKLLEVEVQGAEDLDQARRAARAVVSSNLVKAALFGRDPNFGRIAAALGYSGCRLAPDRITLRLVASGGSVLLVRHGEPRAYSGTAAYRRAHELLRAKEIRIVADLGVGASSATAWGCDLSYEYVRINAEYTT